MTAATGTIQSWEQERPQVFRGSAGMLVGAAVTGAANLLVLVAVARLSDQATTGAFAAVTSLFLIGVAFARLGAPTTLVYFVSRLEGSPAAGSLVSLIRGVLIAVAGASAAVAVLLIAGGDRLVDWTSGDTSAGLMALAPMLWFLPMAALLECVLAISQGMRRMRPTIAIDQTARPIAQLVLVTLALLAKRPDLAAAAWALPYAPALLWANSWTRSLFPHPRSTGAGPSAPAVPPMGSERSRPGDPTGEAAVEPGTASHIVRHDSAALVRYATPRWLAGFVQMTLQRVDIILVAAIAGVAQAAIYTAATRFVILGQMVQLAIGRVIQPRLSGALAQGDMPRVRSLYATTTSWLVLLVWPVFLALALAAAPLLQLFGPEYESGVTVVWILTAAMIAATGVGVADVVLIMSGRSGAGLLNQLAALATMLVVDLALIPSLGIVGAAAGWALALVVRSALPLAQNYRRLGVTPFSRPMATAAAIALASFGGLGVLLLVLLPTSWGWIAAVGCASAVYVAAVAVARERLDIDGLIPGRRPSARGSAS